MTDPRIVSPQEAQRVHAEDITFTLGLDLAYTVATETERTRAAVVKALDEIGQDYSPAYWRARSIENGADW